MLIANLMKIVPSAAHNLHNLLIFNRQSKFFNNLTRDMFSFGSL